MRTKLLIALIGHTYKTCILFFIVSASISSSMAQCLDTLWERVVAIKNSKQIPVSGKLEQLVAWQAEFDKRSCRKDTTYFYLLQVTGANYYKIADFGNAIRHTKKGIDSLKKYSNYNKSVLRFLASGYYNLQIYYDSLKQEPSRMMAIDSCMYYDREWGSDFRYTCEVLYSKINYLFKNGDYKSCLQYAQSGESIFKQYYSGTAANRQLNLDAFFTFKVDALLMSGKYEAAEKMVVEKIIEYLNEGNSVSLGVFHGLLGHVHIAGGEYREAINDFRKSFECNKKIKYRKGCAQSLGQMGVIYMDNLKQYEKAGHSINQALGFADDIDSFYLLGKLGNLFAHKRDFDSAFLFYKLAYSAIASSTSGPLMEKVVAKNADNVTGLLLDIGRAHLTRYHAEHDKTSIQEAIGVFRVIDKLLDRLRAEHRESESKLTWRRNTRDVYELAIETCYLADRKEDAFYFFEKSRSVLLNDALNEQRVLKQEDLLNLAQLKKDRLRLIRERDLSDVSSIAYQEIEKKIVVNTFELDKLQNLIRFNNPYYYNEFIDSMIIDIRLVQDRILPGYEAFMEFFSGDSAFYTLTIASGDIYFNKIDKKQFDSLVSGYTRYVSNKILQNGNFQVFASLSNQLYQLIFAGLPLSPGRIIISPDGKYFPLEALVMRFNGDKPLYLLEQFSISYSYSARYLLTEFRGKRGNTNKNFVGFAPLEYPSIFSLASLPGSDRSLGVLRSHFGGSDNFIATNATRNNFVTQFYKYKVIQLYAHASDSSASGEPVIYFADSALYLSDLIYENKPVTDLIVLSACQTAIGEDFKGEGVFNFNRGFAALGIPSAISNLWSVDSKSTYMLTELFYQFLADGLPTDIALQKAKLTFLEQNEQSLPYYWAATILVGKAEVIKLNKSNVWRWVIPFGCVLLIVVLIAWIMRSIAKAEN